MCSLIVIHVLLILNSDYFVDTNECSSLSTNACQHNCVNTPGSYTCQCRTGFRLNANGRNCTGLEYTRFIMKIILIILLCAEVHECNEGADLCEHTCTNTPGSYVCSCNPGYTLSSNGFTCSSKDHHNIIIFLIHTYVHHSC